MDENKHKLTKLRGVPSIKTIRAVDLFCGAGGSSKGLREAV